MNPALLRATRLSLPVLILFALASSAHATTRHVANNGVDSPSCGTSANPCRSITHAIANAVPGDTVLVGPGMYGDVNGDGIIGAPGEETPSAGCGCMLSVNKSVIVMSSDGAAATVISAAYVNVSVNVAIIADDAEFGRPLHGFTVTSPGLGRNGILINGNHVKVRGNELVGPTLGGSNSGDIGISTVDATETILIDSNEVTNWAEGIVTRGAGKTVSKNHVSLNTNGISGVGAFVANVITANFIGFLLDGTSSATGNAVYANAYAGIIAQSGFNGAIHKSNIFGNGAAFGNNCGVMNNGVAGLDATNNYWGAATGPGADSADAVCGASVTTTPFATSRFVIKPSEP